MATTSNANGLASSKVWFVTGASVGLGRAVVEHALEKGNKVVATLRTPAALSALTSQYPPSKLLIVKLDVTSPSDIAAAFSCALETFGHVDVVYNNAGYSILSEIEGTPDEVARAMFEVNFWGAANVTRETVRIFREANSPPGGRLLQASSMGGIVSTQGLGYYCSSKFALEGLAEAVSKELHPSWNIKVTILQIGGFATRSLTSQSMVTVPPHSAYTTSDSATKLFREYFSGPVDAYVGDPKKAAREIYEIAGDETVSLRIPLGLDAIGFAKTKMEEYQNVVETTPKWSAALNFLK